MAVGKLRGKKKWFTVLAPEIFKSRELVDITAYELKELEGRSVECNFAQLTEKPKDQYKKIILKVVGTKGEKAITEPKQYYLVESFVQRTGRRFKEKLYDVLTLRSKDGKNIKIKLFLLATKLLHHSVRADVLVLTRKKAGEFVLPLDAFEMFLPENIDALASGLQAEVKKIYPIDRILVWKVSVV